MPFGITEVYFAIHLSKSLVPSAVPSRTPRFRSRGRVREELVGDEGTRTPDPRLAKAVLSQLSYIPMLRKQAGVAAPAETRRKTLDRAFPSPTSWLKGGGPLWTRTTDLTVISRAL